MVQASALGNVSGPCSVLGTSTPPSLGAEDMAPVGGLS